MKDEFIKKIEEYGLCLKKNVEKNEKETNIEEYLYEWVGGARVKDIIRHMTTHKYVLKVEKVDTFKSKMYAKEDVENIPDILYKIYAIEMNWPTSELCFTIAYSSTKVERMLLEDVQNNEGFYREKYPELMMKYTFENKKYKNKLLYTLEQSTLKLVDKEGGGKRLKELAEELECVITVMMKENKNKVKK